MNGTRVIDLFATYLKLLNIQYVFGVPGGLLHPFFDRMEKDDFFQLIVTKHEEGAAFMADGYARVSRQMAVCAGVSGPGATNMMTGVAVAYTDGVPLLVITGQAISRFMGKGAAQETSPEDIDMVTMYKPITKYSVMVTQPETFSHHLRRAIRLARSGRPGPVHLNIPVDLWMKEVSARDETAWSEASQFCPRIPVYNTSHAMKAMAALSSAVKPVFLVGSGIADEQAQSRLIELAQLLNAPVATTPRAKGIFPEDHPLSLGVLGFAGHQSARSLIIEDRESIDVLFVIGASLNETTTFNWHPGLKPPQRTLIQCDIDPDRLGRNYPVDIPLLGDGALYLEAIQEQLKATRLGSAHRTTAWTSRSLTFDDDEGQRDANQRPLLPQRWRKDLQEVLPDNAMIFSDIGGHMLFNIHHLMIKRGQKFVLNLGFGSMGHGTVAPIGAALACPDRAVIAIIGDACFTMNGTEFLTAVEYDIPVIWILENNQMHGITWHGSKVVSEGVPLECIRYRKPLDIMGIANGMGVQTWQVSEPGAIQQSFLEALATKKPALIEVKVDESIPPPLADRAKTIAGFKG